MNRREFLLGTAALCAVRGIAAEAAAADRTPGSIRIAHCGDPQFGFGTGGAGGKANAYDDDLARFERVIASVNAYAPDLCYIAGDMTQEASALTRDWPRLLKMFKVPVVVAPGNHDMGNALTKENVERFDAVFGYDYKSVKVGKWRFICGNSQYWRPTDEKARAARYEEWLEAELAEAKRAGEPVILASHIPPMVAGISEPDTLENYPIAGRKERFRRYLDAGARFYLSGHTHRMIARAYGGMMILNAETTCRNFDGLPFGYRRLEIFEDGNYTWNKENIA